MRAYGAEVAAETGRGGVVRWRGARVELDVSQEVRSIRKRCSVLTKKTRSHR